MSFFDIFKRKPKRIAAKPDPKGAPGSRVYHELFLGDPVNGSFPWSARVYAPGHAVSSSSGAAASAEQARAAAITWAEQTKATKRGEA